jgi:hypothetical protein
MVIEASGKLTCCGERRQVKAKRTRYLTYASAEEFRAAFHEAYQEASKQRSRPNQEYIAEKLGIVGGTVRKHCRRYGLDYSSLR